MRSTVRVGERWVGTVPAQRPPVMTKTPDPRSREPEALAWSFSVQVVAQHLRSRRVAQLRHRLDLADPLAGDPVDLPDLVQRPRPAVREAEPQPHDTGLALAQ